MKKTDKSKRYSRKAGKIIPEGHGLCMLRKDIWFEDQDRITEIRLFGLLIFRKREIEILTALASIPGYRT